MTFLMRVSLPDVPGSLGTLASAIGTVGANIEAIEIVEHCANGTAVDDVLLDLPRGVMPDSVVSACQQLDGVKVLWISRYAAGASLQLDLEAVEAMTEDPDNAVAHLVEMVPTVFRVDWSALVRRDGEAAVVQAATSAAPDLAQVAAAWLPLPARRRLDVPADDDAWSSTLVAGVPVGKKGARAVVIGRRGGPEFLDSELARLAHLADVAATMARRH